MMSKDGESLYIIRMPNSKEKSFESHQMLVNIFNLPAIKLCD